ncbi:hypothetical protein NMY22_g14866 [Coprinellus aureogranulatus]|nr:hypothetical protein NMY22_g14866 [Coprinellus aureogranulatus]
MHASLAEEAVMPHVKAFLHSAHSPFLSAQILHSGQWRNPKSVSQDLEKLQVIIRMIALCFGSPERTLQFLLKGEASRELFSMQPAFDRSYWVTGQDSMHIAAFWGLDLTLRTILSECGPLEARDSDGWTPLHWAAANGQIETVKTLLEGPTVTQINTKDERGVTPLEWAKLHGHVGTIDLLIERGAEQSGQDRIESLRLELDRTGWLDRHEFPDAFHLRIDRGVQTARTMFAPSAKRRYLASRDRGAM